MLDDDGHWNTKSSKIDLSTSYFILTKWTLNVVGGGLQTSSDFKSIKYNLSAE